MYYLLKWIKFSVKKQNIKKNIETRMHSSRMCTVRCNGCGTACIPACTGQGGMYPSMHWAGGCLSGGSAQGVSAQRGVSTQGVSATHPLPTVDRRTDACVNITLLLSGSSPLTLEHTWVTGTSQLGYLTCL